MCIGILREVVELCLSQWFGKKREINNAFVLGRSLITAILRKMEGIGRCQYKFMSDIFLLMLTLPHRANFVQLGRYGQMCEQSYRLNFGKPFDFIDFNIRLIDKHSSGELILGFDPSYITKSGKHTPGLGYFYSGVAERYKHGLEIGSLCAIDLVQNTAYHIEATQSPSARKGGMEAGQTLVDHYAQCIVRVGSRVDKLSHILVVDGYFAKRKFIDAIKEKTSMEIVCRLRDDANLRYLVIKKNDNVVGWPKLYEGKVDEYNIGKRRLQLVCKEDRMEIYEGVVFSVGLKRKIKIAYTVFYDKTGQREMLRK